MKSRPVVHIAHRFENLCKPSRSGAGMVGNGSSRTAGPEMRCMFDDEHQSAPSHARKVTAGRAGGKTVCRVAGVIADVVRASWYVPPGAAKPLSVVRIGRCPLATANDGDEAVRLSNGSPPRHVAVEAPVGRDSYRSRHIFAKLPVTSARSLLLDIPRLHRGIGRRCSRKPFVPGAEVNVTGTGMKARVKRKDGAATASTAAGC